MTREEPAAPLLYALNAALPAAGIRHRFAPVRMAEELRRAIIEVRDQGLLARSLYEEYKDYFKFSPPPEVPKPRTIIVLAWPSPAVKVRFHLDGGSLDAVIPPTYISSAGRERCLKVLRSVLEPAGHSVGRASGPVKLLAVWTGLARYGRNNLAYVPGLGTFTRLDAFCTDADLKAGERRSDVSLLMSRCLQCRLCHDACPTGCIPRDGTVIDARHCLAHYNENEPGWPKSLDARAHNSLVGCMRCQEVCPVNRRYMSNEAVVAEFDREETAIILQNLSPEHLPDVVRVKLRRLDLEEYSTVLGRNLLAVKEASGSTPVR